MVYFELLSVLGFLELEVTKRLLYANSSELVSPSVAITRHIRSTGRLQVDPHYIVVASPLFRFLQSLGGPAAAQSEGRALSGARSEGA